MDASTKRVLFGKEETKIMYPASTTKIVTLITALGLAVGACTVVTDPSSGSSATTGP